jgi:membrane fusion protein, multidrug efflux system
MHDGLVVGLTISTGEMVGPGQLLFTLINTEEWFADWNFRETDFAAIARQGAAAGHQPTSAHGS